MVKANVTVILVNWNGKSILPKALNSLRGQAYTNFTTIVVDNYSEDGSVDMLKARYPEVKIIQLSKNYGFAKAVNIATSKINTKYFALLNTDAVAHKDWLQNLVKTAQEDDNLAVITAVSLLPGGNRIDALGDGMSRWGVAFPIMRGIENNGSKVDHNQVIFSGSGGYSLYSVDVWKKIGGFDDSFFMYYEDVDYCYRARLYGYDIKLSQYAYITHRPGVSSNKRGKNFSRRYVIRNAQYVYWKNTPQQIVIRTLLKFCIVNIYMVLAALKALAFKELIVAYIEFLVSVPQIYSDRKKIQKNAEAWNGIYNLMAPQWPFGQDKKL